MMYPSEVLEFSGDHFDSGTVQIGEFRLFPKMSDFGFYVADPRKNVVSRLFFRKNDVPLRSLRIFW